MNYHINPDTSVNYNKLKEEFEEIKKLELVETQPEIKIILSNNYYSTSIVNFINEIDKYIGITIELVLIKEKSIEKIIGPIIFNNSKQVLKILSYLVEFNPRDSVDFESELIKNYISSLNYNSQINLIIYE
jgi:hypothetical protein